MVYADRPAGAPVRRICPSSASFRLPGMEERFRIIKQYFDQYIVNHGATSGARKIAVTGAGRRDRGMEAGVRRGWRGRCGWPAGLWHTYVGMTNLPWSAVRGTRMLRCRH